MRRNKFVVVGQAAFTALATLGCTGFPTFQGGQTTPLGATRPGPMKQLATSVSESRFGQSVSKVFQTAKKKPAPENDPTSLAAGVVPTKASDYVAMGENLEQNGDGESARRMFHKALEMEPHHLGALVGLGRHFDRQGQFDRASEHYLEATKYYPNDAIAFNDLGLSYARQRRFDEAVTALSRAVELAPDRALYRNNIAMVLVAQNRIDEALSHLTDAHGPAIAHYNVGFLLNRRGMKKAALDQFQLALNNDPSMADAREWVDALNLPMEQGGEQMLAAAPDSIAPQAEEPDSPPDSAAPHGRENVAVRNLVPPVSTAAEAAGKLQPLPPVVDEASPATRRY